MISPTPDRSPYTDCYKFESSHGVLRRLSLAISALCQSECSSRASREPVRVTQAVVELNICPDHRVNQVLGAVAVCRCRAVSGGLPHEAFPLGDGPHRGTLDSV